MIVILFDIGLTISLFVTFHAFFINI
jgi:hypothetical protein